LLNHLQLGLLRDKNLSETGRQHGRLKNQIVRRGNCEITEQPGGENKWVS